MSVTLLDANALLALTWPHHEHHVAALTWFENNAAKGWATCSVTELAFVRISSTPSFSPAPATPGEAIDALAHLREIGRHFFFSATPSVLALEHLKLRGYRQFTDAFLVVLAEEQEARVATFDGALKQYAKNPLSVEVLAPR